VEILALIPARGGSKSIHRKNLLPVAGKPLLAHSIAHAQASKGVTRVIVSTDDDEIARVAWSYESEVLMRPAEFATDTACDLDVFYHALTSLLEQNYLPQLVVHLRPTMPYRREGDIDKAIALLQADPDADSLRSVSKAKQSPYKMWVGPTGGYITPFYNDDDGDALLRAKMGNSNGKPSYIKWFGEQHSMPRQLLRQFLHQNGYIDVIRPNTILRKMKMAGDKVLPFMVEGLPDDIDYLGDVAALEAAMGQKQEGERYAT
jgi:CMP-N,N'-diacetyllegionaminic acid synthase